MKIATFNVNGITSRLPRLLEWLAESSPDIACLQELKTSDETFPIQAIRDATGWDPSVLLMALLLLSFGLLVFAVGYSASAVGGRDQRPAA